MSAITPPIGPTAAASVGAHGADRRRARLRAEFVRVFNFGTVAVVFYLCLTLTFARWLPIAAAEGARILTTSGIVSLRQTLISGLLTLAAIAFTRASVVSRRDDASIAPRALPLGLAAAALAATASAFIRLWVYGTPLPDLNLPWLAGVVLLWTLLGFLGYALVVFAQEDEASRCALADQARAQESLRAQMTQAHLSALQAQIEPHFLFNTLATVKRLYETAPDRGREMLSSLIGYLRAALPSMRMSGSTVARELDLAHAYLTVLKMRMGERLQFVVETADDLRTAEMPPLVLGTLLENAIKHGLGGLPEGGRIEIRVARAPTASADSNGPPRLQLEVRDDGAGFTGEGGSGMGLANTRSRLAALYGDSAALRLECNEPRGVVARVLLPIRLTSATPGAGA
ncbi:MAG: histidine kinase [Burkholderiaceae bacterium]|jgi:signal transduction histidine kinase|nr:histidine kinase [Burkholderiaceae bacterium]